MMSGSRIQQKAGVIIPAAGFGTRMQSTLPKQFLELAGEPILLRTIKTFLNSKVIHWISLAVAADQRRQTNALLKKYIQPEQLHRILVSEGGATRQQSVKAGLDALPEDVEIILVHDGARPLISSDLINDCLQGAMEQGAIIAAIAVNDTIKQVDTNHTITKTIDRSRLYRAQTPQAAKRYLLEQAYQQAAQDNFTGTDEASLLEHAGIPVTIITGEERNMKITRPDDLQIARSLLGERPMMRIGHGFDAHRLVENRPLILGGITIDFPLGLLGHSDADVLTHAFIDAILGALGQGDIGKHFPDSDNRYKGINSLKLLEQTFKLAEKKGYSIGNADLTILCQRPKLAPHLDTMRRKLADCCKTQITAINIKATTTEEMGYTGRGEGIASHAVVLLHKKKS
jgi:2-C-methyl-D-erythritol 4-phosphate cytidylyltransferase/2-C-methyl-D-erythritol 2,4-cyclodiphosphate synthase